MSPDAAAETRTYGRSASLLTAAVGMAGLLTYLFFALLSHSLSGDDYGAVVVIWSAVYITSSTFFRPIEQLLARALAELGQGPGAPQRRVLRVAGRVQLGLVALVLALALALRGPISDGLLESEATLYALLLAALLGFGAAFFARGLLAGKRNVRGYAALVLLESAVRMIFALAIAIGVSDDPAVAAAGVAAAPIVSLLVLPFALRRAARRAEPGPVTVGGVEGPEFTLSAGGAFAACVLVIMLGEQLLVNSGVLFVRAAEGAAEAGFMFNVLMLVRAPLVLFLAIAASLLPHLSKLRARGGPGDAEAFRGAVRQTLTVVAGFAAAAMVGVLVAGPQAMQIAFGETYEYDRLGLAIVAGGLGFYLAASTLSQATLAQGQARRAAACWALCAGGFVLWNLIGVGGLEQVRQVEIGFSTAAALLCGLLYAVYRQPRARREDAIDPGSPRDLEVGLATADEVA